MRETIEFRLGQQHRSLANADPTMTVLDWLRTEARLTGTKEGCAEGDCGACSVVLVDQRGRHQAVNACVLFLPALDGKQLLTVEHLEAADGTLDPVQEALVSHHASQCGFCTPGFVMSLHALRMEGGTLDRQAVNEALAGNLCRCTGYRPIVDAALAACAQPATAPPPAPTLPDGALALTFGPATCFAPRSVADLAATLEQHPDAVIVAGGTDVGLWVTKQHRKLPVTVSLDAVEELSAINDTADAIRIGAAATYTDVLPVLGAYFPDFGVLIRRIGSRQIRNRGTLGGNIANASSIGDMPPPLLALDASLVLRKGSVQRTVALDAFFIGYRRTVLAPGEFIERIDIPKPAQGSAFRCYKVSKRFDQDISAVCGAFRLRLDRGVIADLRIAYGGMAATPLRLPEVEAALVGKPWTEATIHAAQAMLDSAMAPLSDMRASAAYRRSVARNLLLKFFLETSEKAAVTRLEPA